MGIGFTERIQSIPPSPLAASSTTIRAEAPCPCDKLFEWSPELAASTVSLRNSCHPSNANRKLQHYPSYQPGGACGTFATADIGSKDLSKNSLQTLEIPGGCSERVNESVTAGVKIPI